MPSKQSSVVLPPPKPLTKSELDGLFSPFDLARLDSYANNMLDYHVVLDLLPSLAHLYFTNRLSTPPSNVSLSGVQQAILLAIGLQRKDLSAIEKELDVPSSQLLAMFIKVVRKISTAFRSIVEADITKDMPKEVDASRVGGSQSIGGGSRIVVAARATNGSSAKHSTTDNQQDADEEDPELKSKQRELVNALPLDRYELVDDSVEVATNDNDDNARWAEAERQIREGGTSTVSVKGTKKRKLQSEDEEDAGTKDSSKKKDKKDKHRISGKHGKKDKRKG